VNFCSKEAYIRCQFKVQKYRENISLKRRAFKENKLIILSVKKCKIRKINTTEHISGSCKNNYNNSEVIKIKACKSRVLKF